MVKFIASEITTNEGAGGDLIITIAAPLSVAGQLKKLDGLFDVEIKRHRERRSLNANALCWAVIGSIADILGVSDIEIYMQMLEQYGVKKYIVVKPDAVESVKPLFRSVEEMGSVIVDGKKGVQLKCVIGSSQYDTKQFSRLLEGVINESREIGGLVPDKNDVMAAIDLWDKERRT